MRIKYNAPVVLTFTFISVIVMILTQLIFKDLMDYWFVVPGRGGFSANNPRNWINLWSHAIGHADWNHLISNFALILLIGPILEESYGSLALLFMMFVTALITGILNIFFFSTGLLGASGIVFMMIILASFTNFKRGEIPLTFLLVAALYLGGEFIASAKPSNVSHFAHILGGICGSLFGFLRGTEGNPQNKLQSKKKSAANQPIDK